MVLTRPTLYHLSAFLCNRPSTRQYVLGESGSRRQYRNVDVYFRACKTIYTTSTLNKVHLYLDRPGSHVLYASHAIRSITNGLSDSVRAAQYCVLRMLIVSATGILLLRTPPESAKTLTDNPLGTAVVYPRAPLLYIANQSLCSNVDSSGHMERAEVRATSDSNQTPPRWQSQLASHAAHPPIIVAPLQNQRCTVVVEA